MLALLVSGDDKLALDATPFPEWNYVHPLSHQKWYLILCALLGYQFLVCCILCIVEVIVFCKRSDLWDDLLGTVCSKMICPKLKMRWKDKRSHTGCTNRITSSTEALDEKTIPTCSCCKVSVYDVKNVSRPKNFFWRLCQLPKGNCPLCEILSDLFSRESIVKSSNCNVHCTWASFYKMHLPPPLPLRKRRISKKPDIHHDNNIIIRAKHTGNSGISSVEPSSKVSYTTYDKSRILSIPSSVQITASLIDLTRMRHWSSILQLARENHLSRKQAKFRDSHGLMPLHWACSGAPPVDVINALIDVYPPGVRKVDDNGSTPLHFAAHYSASLDVIKALLNAYPDSIRQTDKYGRSPLYHAVDRQASLEVLRMLVNASPSMITNCLRLPRKLSSDVASDDTGSHQHSTSSSVRSLDVLHSNMNLRRAEATLSPLHLVWASAKTVLLRKSKVPGVDYTKEKLWTKACMLLDVAWQVHNEGHHETIRKLSSITVERDHSGIILHAAIGLDMYLPEFVVPLIMRTYPEQVYKKNIISGQLPLAQLARMDSYSTARSTTLIKLLLETYPQAAFHRDTSGSSPLSLAVSTASNKAETVNLLFHASPESLEWRERTTGLPPFLLAAVTSNENIKNENEKSALTVSDFHFPHSMSTIDVPNQENEYDIERLEIIYILLRANPVLPV